MLHVIFIDRYLSDEIQEDKVKKVSVYIRY